MALNDFGPYRIVRRIAVGGMAEVYLARQRGLEGLERTVVIKQILPSYAQDAEFVTMFLDEARLMAALSHPNIAQVFDLGQLDGNYHLVVEHVHGPTLGRLLSAARLRPERTLPVAEALGIALYIAEALYYVHGRRDELGRPLGIVHRDLNPSNVMVSYDGAVKLIDFGIAKAACRVYETRTGVIKGTYGYSAPEQLTGGKIDLRADVFALGILLYEMIAGEHPYDVSDEPNLIDRIALARYPRPRDVRPEISDDLDRLITSCIAFVPEARPQDMGVLLDALSLQLAQRGAVPTQARLAATARALVPDTEGPRPLRRPTEVSRPAPIVVDPGGTRSLRARPAAREEPTTDPNEAPPPTWEDGTVRLTSEESTVPEMPSVADVEDVPTVSLKDEDPNEAKTRLRPRTPDAIVTPARSETSTAVLPPRRVAPTWALVVAVALGGGFVVSATSIGLWAAFSSGDGDGIEATPILPGEAPAPRISVISEPPGASVYVDGRLMPGVTPLSVTLPPATRQTWLRLSLDGHVDQERQVSAGAGEARFVLSPSR